MNKNNSRINLFLTLVLTVSVICGMAICRSENALAYDEQQSSFEYKKYESNAQYRSELKRTMPNVSQVISSKMDDAKTMPIPGIISTYVETDGDTDSSSQFVPQGLCRAGDYILITAYDAKRKHNSVVYAIDTTRNKLVSTLTMPNKYHAGGIAFDGENIWMTGNTSDKFKGEPFVQYLTYEKFSELIQEPTAEVSKKDLSKHIAINNKPSFLECDDGILWVGTYIGSKGSAEGYMNGYPIVKRDGRTALNTLMYKVITGIDSSAQGADIDGNYLYVSSSYMGMIYGLRSSFITKYSIASIKRGAESLHVKRKEISRVEVPKMNEEILVEGQTVHINFESGSERWKSCVIVTDRILALRKSLWSMPS